MAFYSQNCVLNLYFLLGSLKRKRRGTFGGGGVGHAIKKPKLNKSIEAKPVKISELPVPVVVDLPSGSSAYNQTSKTPSRSSLTPTTSGQASSRILCPFYKYEKRHYHYTSASSIR